MKMFGKKIQGPNIEILVIPRPEQDVVFKAQTVMDMKRFEELCPKPTPPKVRRRNEGLVEDLQDKNFILSLEQWGEKFNDYMCLESLKATDGLEWETVDYGNSDTWKNWTTELQESGFSQTERNLIIRTINRANSLDEGKMQEARDRFLQSQQEQASNGQSHVAELKIMPSGDPANGLV